jgi:hypothetical protein
VLLLADVWENFRTSCISYYKLDPTNYISAPGLAWDAMLLQTKIELELTYRFKHFRNDRANEARGLCFVGSQRHTKANNKYLDDYNPDEPSTNIIYWDENNQYGGAMSQPLPYKDLALWNH